ncbi:MAG: hypothetical protein ACK5Q5_04020 [Planctomycetaceae bacterium]
MQRALNLLRPVALALVLAVGTQVIWSFVVTMIWQSTQPQFNRGLQNEYMRESVAFTNGGDPAIQLQTTRYSPSYSVQRQFFAATDRSPLDEADIASSTPAALGAIAQYSIREWNRVLNPSLTSSGYPTSWAIDGNPVEVDRIPYLVISDDAMQQSYLELFEPLTNRRLGFVGTKGFQETQPQGKQRFDCHRMTTGMSSERSAPGFGHLGYADLLQLSQYVQSDRWSGKPSGRQLAGRATEPPLAAEQSIIVSNGQALLIDTADGSVQPILSDRDVLSVALVARYVPSNPDRLIACVAVRTLHKLWLVHPPTDERIEFALPADLQPESINIACLPDGRVTVEQNQVTAPMWGDQLPTHHKVDTWVLAPKENATSELPPLAVAVTLRYLSDSPPQINAPLNAVTMFSGSPGFSGLLLFGVLPWLEEVSGGLSLGETYSRIAQYAGGSLLLIVLLAAVLTWLAARHRRKHRLPPSWGWMAFVFLLGLPGFCGYLCHRRWPVVKPQPAPQPLGFEVFSPPGTTATL